MLSFAKRKNLTLGEYIGKLDPMQRNHIHFSRTRMYIFSQEVWDLTINTFDEQLPKYQHRLIKLLKRRRWTNIISLKKTK